MLGKIISVDWDQVRKAASPSSPAQTAVPSEPRADPYSDDPFFKRNPDSTWNACIGKQGYEEHYIDGYIDARLLALLGGRAAPIDGRTCEDMLSKAKQYIDEHVFTCATVYRTCEDMLSKAKQYIDELLK